MAKQDKEKKKEDQQETPEQAEVSRQLREMSEKSEPTIKEKIEKLHQVDADDLAQEVVEELKYYENTRSRTLELENVFVNPEKKIGAALLEEHSWGSDGGVQWNITLKLQKGRDRAELEFLAARARAGAKHDMPQFWYGGIQDVLEQDGNFFVKFNKKGEESDKSEPWWQIPANKSFTISRDDRGEIIANEEGTFENKEGKVKKTISPKRYDKFNISKLKGKPEK